MAWGFKKSIKVAPGLKINLNKRSVSARVGPKNVGATIGAKGVHASASAPGTGLSVRTKVGGKRSRKRDSEGEFRQIESERSSAGSRLVYGFALVAFVFAGLVGLLALSMN